MMTTERLFLSPKIPILPSFSTFLYGSLVPQRHLSSPLFLPSRPVLFSHEAASGKKSQEEEGGFKYFLSSSSSWVPQRRRSIFLLFSPFPLGRSLQEVRGDEKRPVCTLNIYFSKKSSKLFWPVSYVGDGRNTCSELSPCAPCFSFYRHFHPVSCPFIHPTRRRRRRRRRRTALPSPFLPPLLAIGQKVAGGEKSESSLIVPEKKLFWLKIFLGRIIFQRRVLSWSCLFSFDRNYEIRRETFFELPLFCGKPPLFFLGKWMMLFAAACFPPSSLFGKKSFFSASAFAKKVEKEKKRRGQTHAELANKSFASVGEREGEKDTKGPFFCGALIFPSPPVNPSSSPFQEVHTTHTFPSSSRESQIRNYFWIWIKFRKRHLVWGMGRRGE